MEKGGKLSAALGQLCEAGFVAVDGWESVMGYAFENLVMNNYAELMPSLHCVAAAACNVASQASTREHENNTYNLRQ